MNNELRIMEKKKIKSFTDLEAWKKGHEIVLIIYKITRRFPKEEMFGLIGQMRRCAVSITSNIAEGFSRFSYKEKAQFYLISLGSVTELQDQLLISKDIDYITKEKLAYLAEKIIVIHKLLNGLIKSSKTHDS